jgi:parallel beta-helix repeat protein
MEIHRRVVRPAVLLASSALLAATVGSVASAQAKSHHGANKRTLYVAPAGKARAKDLNCKSAAYSSVQSAVNAAKTGSTVVVCKGTYTGDIVISTSLTLSGKHGSVIKGSPSTTFMCDQLGATGPGRAACLAGITIKSSRVTVQGLEVTGAIGEGILATGSLKGGSISNVTIQHNQVTGNNLGGIPPSTTSPYPQCVEQGQVPGDCGEGIHLMGVADSTVSNNSVTNNVGGILLTDEFGPTHRNVVSHNTISQNAYDCGVTAPGHNPHALDANGNPQPSVAGVYDNTISHNTITDNGLKGEGAGVLFANAAAGTASYDNLVEFNTITGNELAGVTMHAHTVGPGQFEDLSGNQIVNNTIGTNNTGGDPLDGTATDTATTGILVFSGTVPVTVTISNNQISSDTNGIWLGVGGHVTATQSGNVFQGVTTSVFTSP